MKERPFTDQILQVTTELLEADSDGLDIEAAEKKDTANLV